MTCRKCKRDVTDAPYCCQCGAKQSAGQTQRRPKSRGNGAGTAFKRGKTWRVEVTLGTRVDPASGKTVPDRRTKGGFATKSEALAYVPILKEGKRAENEKAISTLRDHWNGYSEGKMAKLSPGKQLSYKIAFAKLRDIADRPVGLLTINTLQQLVDEKAPTYYPARDIKVLLSHLYKRAMAQQEVTVNLSEFIALPPLEEKEPVPFTEGELRSLWNDYGDGHKFTGYILLMIYSGMMPGELFLAQKSMIDWQGQRITGCGLKTKKRKETPIVIADFILPVLQDLCMQTKGDYLLDMKRDAFYEEFHTTLARCGCADRTPYICRHTTATALALGDIAPEIIREVMRHTKLSTTERYIHKDINTTPLLQAVNTIKKG